MSRSTTSHRIRTALIAFLAVVGGLLQYAYTSTNHPSTLLRVWAYAYGVSVVLVIASLAARCIQWLRDRRNRPASPGL